MIELLNEQEAFLLEGNKSKDNFYTTKYMMKPLGLGYQKIDMCPNFCMLYYLKNAELTQCRACEHPHYKTMNGRGMTLIVHRRLRYFSITPRLQRLFMSPKTVKHMTRHLSYDVVDGVMMHLSGSEAQKHFNNVHPQFSMETRNMRLRLCIDGFNPSRSFIALYFYWPMIFTVYNL